MVRARGRNRYPDAFLNKRTRRYTCLNAPALSGLCKRDHILRCVPPYRCWSKDLSRPRAGFYAAFPKGS